MIDQKLILVLLFISSHLFAQDETPIYKEKEERDLPTAHFTLIKPDGKYGVINSRDGSLVVPATYDQLRKISDAMPYYLAMMDGKWGVIDLKGKVRIPFLYDELEIVNLSKKSYELYTLSEEEFVFKAKNNTVFGIIDINNKILMPIEFRYIEAASGDWFTVARGVKQGVISLREGTLIPVEYEDLSHLKTGVYLVKKNGLFGIRTTKGEVLLKDEYVEIRNFDNMSSKYTPRYTAQHSSCKSGVWDVNLQKMVIPCVYDKIIEQVGENIILIKDKKYGMVSATNKQLVPFEYSNLHFISLDPARPLLASKIGKFGLINYASQPLVDFQFDVLQPISPRFFKACKNGKCKIIDGSGRALVKDEFDAVGVFVKGWVKVFEGSASTFISETGERAELRKMQSVNGFTELKDVFAAFVSAMQSKDEKTIQAFATKIVPDSATVAFFEESKFEYRTLMYSLEKKNFTLQELRDRYSTRLMRVFRTLDEQGLIEALTYVDTGHKRYLRGEEFAVEGMPIKALFSSGDKKILVALGDLERLDGVWKVFENPSVDVE